ncbi:oxygenase MpaB family protein [Rhizobiaceae sp. 2RAB30]
MTSGIIPLPSVLERRVDKFARSVMRQPPGYRIDFSLPAGEPALLSPDSLSWRIFKNPVTVFVGGVAAVLLELAEPRVRDAVWQHSGFRSDALSRLRRTGAAAMVTIYGPRSQAEAMIAGVVRMHGRIHGRTSDGEPYDANDPELLDWVQATAGFGFTQAYHRYARPLRTEERDASLAEGRPIALLYGAIGAPHSQADLYTLFEARRERLAPSPIVLEFLDIMANVPVLPASMRLLQMPLLKAAIDILPLWVRERLGLGDRWRLRPRARALVVSMAGACERIVLPSSPAVQSCRRLGLADDYLYRRHDVNFSRAG